MSPEDRFTGRDLATDARGVLDQSAGDIFRRGWWALTLRGLAAIVLGIFVLTRPGLTVSLFVALLGIYLFVDGLFALVATFHAAERGRTWWPYLLEGLVSIAVGIMAFARPGSLLLALIILIAIRALVVGAAEIGTGVAVRRASGSTPWLLYLGGLASIAFAILLFVFPRSGLFALVWVVGVYAIVFGVLMDAEAFRMHGVYTRAHRRLEERPT
jgi:uncharacterized membrane protein HdeD (DUF308 family)